ncbi:uncharacterized protein LOC129580306 [Sitodiplosis mosellana]|uniref:uncharacterized protein LOC129580306 n=1 Tax=Sitodiplosis mosellana TaxID=263140 RepID=UPI0024440AC0|nr:uncharacterized protein LOC129580306 [Sitodiplosis mosellana]
MFQVFSRRLLMSNSSAVGALQFSRLDSTLPNRIRAKEIRDVKLIGTIHQEPFALQDGSKILTIKTQSDTHYKLHRAIIRNTKLLEILGDNLSSGQRVYLSGELQSATFTTSENKQRQSFQVKVNEIFASKTETNATNDYNNVCILSHMASDILHFDQHSVFSLCGHFVAKNVTDGESERVQFYRVYVHDKELIQFLKTNVQKRDRILVNGFLNGKSETDENGKSRYAGHIEATQIVKVDRLVEAVNENPVGEEINTANQ